MRPLLPTLTLALALCAAPGARAIDVDLVPVGDPGNAGNPSFDDIGAVPYVYGIGRFEVTNSEYAEFLDAVARDADAHALWNPNMGILSTTGGVLRIPAEGDPPYDYRAKDGYLQRPVNYVSWVDAARFVNWLENGAPADANSDPDAVTETGTYDMAAYELAISTRDLSEIPDPPANPDASWFLPIFDEWYKAAFYDPFDPDATDGYWLYPMQTNDVTCALPGGGGTANCEGPFSLQGTVFVAAYPNSNGHYGTSNQGGNVREWTEELFQLGPSGPVRAPNLGGGYNGDREELESTGQTSSLTTGTEGPGTGMRVAFMPEPTAAAARAAALAVALLAAGLRRRR